MQDNKRVILCTRPISKALVQEAATQGIIIEELSFIDTHPVLTEVITDRIREIAGETRTVIFTSMNAVDAVTTVVTAPVHWNIYCIGNTTKKLILEKLPTARIVATGESAARLAERLVDDGVKEAVFFCGNIRRDELPNKLRSEGGMVEEVIVYETQERPTVLTKEYDAVLFFSPSAVNSFFSTNKIPKQTEVFAIGKTTAEAIRQYLNKRIIVAHVTGKEELVQRAIAHFTGVNR